MDSKEAATKLNPFVWFQKLFFLSFIHLVRSTKDLNSLMLRHTKDTNDFVIRKQEREKNIASFIILASKTEERIKAVLLGTTSIFESLIDNLCDHKEQAFDFIFYLNHYNGLWERIDAFWWCLKCSGYLQKCLLLYTIMFLYFVMQWHFFLSEENSWLQQYDRNKDWQCSLLTEKYSLITTENKHICTSLVRSQVRKWRNYFLCLDLKFNLQKLVVSF